MAKTTKLNAVKTAPATPPADAVDVRARALLEVDVVAKAVREAQVMGWMLETYYLAESTPEAPIPEDSLYAYCNVMNGRLHDAMLLLDLMCDSRPAPDKASDDARSA